MDRKKDLVAVTTRWLQGYLDHRKSYEYMAEWVLGWSPSNSSQCWVEILTGWEQLALEGWLRSSLKEATAQQGAKNSGFSSRNEDIWFSLGNGYIFSSWVDDSPNV